MTQEVTLNITSSPPSLPPRHARQRVGGPKVVSLTLHLRTTTPIMGGGTTLRDVDRVDVIRAPTIRGHLRFWWRALYAHQYSDAKALYAAERLRFGGMSDHKGQDDQGSRCPVELHVSQVFGTDLDQTDLDYRSKGFYALWPAQSLRQENKPQAPRYKAGLSFRLRLTFPETYRQEIERAARAWVLFGGYGGRTRRGLGSLRLLSLEGGQLEDWLPKALTAAELKRVLGVELGGDAVAATDTPSLQGARLWADTSLQDAEGAWLRALGWMRDFRQGIAPKGQINTRGARNPGESSTSKPGRSNWPEADKLRLITNRHEPRHKPMLKSKRPCWPRAVLGLPIVGQFIDPSDPANFELSWQDRDKRTKNRLASPVIVTSVQLLGEGDRRFVAAALWLRRGFPEGAQIGKLNRSQAQIEPQTLAGFDVVEVDGELPRYEALRHGARQPLGERVKAAFAWFLSEHTDANEVT